VFTGRRKRDALLGELLAIQGVWNLNQDSRAVPAQRIGADGPAMIEVVQDQQRLLNQRVTRPTFDIGDKPDPAGVVLHRRRVKPLTTCAVDNGLEGGFIHGRRDLSANVGASRTLPPASRAAQQLKSGSVPNYWRERGSG